MYRAPGLAIKPRHYSALNLAATLSRDSMGFAWQRDRVRRTGGRRLHRRGQRASPNVPDASS
jgi:hypothetical protein